MSITDSVKGIAIQQTYIVVYRPIAELCRDDFEDLTSDPPLFYVCAVRVVVRFAVAELRIPFLFFAFGAGGSGGRLKRWWGVERRGRDVGHFLGLHCAV